MDGFGCQKFDAEKRFHSAETQHIWQNLVLIIPLRICPKDIKIVVQSMFTPPCS